MCSILEKLDASPFTIPYSPPNMRNYDAVRNPLGYFIQIHSCFLCKGLCISCRSHPAQNTIHFQIIFPSTWLKKKFSTSLFWISDDGEIKKRICEAVMNTRFLIPNGMVITSDTVPTSTPHLFCSTHPLTHVLKSKTTSCVSSCVHLF